MKISRFTKSVVLLNGAVPVILLGWDALLGDLGANPANFAIRTTGMLSLIFLILSLTITPVSRLADWNWLSEFRRSAGLYAFFHTVLHFLLFFAFDVEGKIGQAVAEIALRPFLMVGAFALVLMVPLAVTSTDSMVRRMGPRRWKRLHRLAYIIAVAGTVHFFLSVKSDTTRPMVAVIALVLLFAYRILDYYESLRKEAATLKRLDLTPKTELPKSSSEVPQPQAKQAPTKAVAISLEFVRSGKKTTEMKGRTVLEIAEDHGVDIPYNCRSGYCGDCKVQLLSGNVRMESEDALDQTEIANRIILACQAHCLDNVQVDV